MFTKQWNDKQKICHPRCDVLVRLVLCFMYFEIYRSTLGLTESLDTIVTLSEGWSVDSVCSVLRINGLVSAGPTHSSTVLSLAMRGRRHLSGDKVIWNSLLLFGDKFDTNEYCWPRKGTKGCSAVRLINGKPYESYSETLKQLGIMRLSERREMICPKFANNCLRLGNFKKLFPMHVSKHGIKTRHEEKYQISNNSKPWQKICKFCYS